MYNMPNKGFLYAKMEGKQLWYLTSSKPCLLSQHLFVRILRISLKKKKKKTSILKYV